MIAVLCFISLFPLNDNFFNRFLICVHVILIQARSRMITGVLKNRSQAVVFTSTFVFGLTLTASFRFSN